MGLVRQKITKMADKMVVASQFVTGCCRGHSKIASEYDQEIPQSKTTAKPMAPRERATQQSRDITKIN